jgi:hypothetical protein
LFLLRLFSFFLTILALSTLVACKRNAATPPASQTPATTNYEQAQGGTTSVGETKYFKGSIGSTLGLEMKLLREADKLSGNYFYQKVGTKIDVRGTIDNDGNVVLDEFDAAGKQTGVFKGTWTTDPLGLIQLAGNWSKPNSDKQTAFSLHEEPIRFTGAVEIIAKRIKEANKKLKYEIDAEYPQLSGSTNPNAEKFNQNARALVAKKVSDFRKEMAPSEATDAAEATAEPTPETMGSDLGIGYTVALANDELISIEFSVGSYYSGAAHPNSYTEVLNFDLKNGKALRLAELFNPGAKYIQAIANYSVADLKKQSKEKDGILDDDWIQRGAGPEAENYKSWTISPKGLAISFDAYQVGPYAAGPQEVFIPYSALKDLIKADGPLRVLLG